MLRGHRDVRQAAVLAADRAGEPALVGYVVPRRGSALAKPGTDVLEELRPQLRAALPDYMVPALVVVLPALPLTPNAKVDPGGAASPAVGCATVGGAGRGTEEPGRRDPGRHLGRAARLAGADRRAPTRPVRAGRPFADGHPVRGPGGARVRGEPAGAPHLRRPHDRAELAARIAADPDFSGSPEPPEPPEPDPGSGRARDLPSQAALEALSDEDLDELLRAALAQRNRRQAATGGAES